MKTLEDKCVACGSNIIGECINDICYVYCPKCFVKEKNGKFRFSSNRFSKSLILWRKHENIRRHFYDKRRNGKTVVV